MEELRKRVNDFVFMITATMSEADLLLLMAEAKRIDLGIHPGQKK